MRRALAAAGLCLSLLLTACGAGPDVIIHNDYDAPRSTPATPPAAVKKAPYVKPPASKSIKTLRTLGGRRK